MIHTTPPPPQPYISAHTKFYCDAHGWLYPQGLPDQGSRALPLLQAHLILLLILMTMEIMRGNFRLAIN